MLITTQRKLEFGQADQPAMDKRLRNYFFRSLPQVKKRASSWMKKHAMDCVAWAAQRAEACEEDTESGDESDTCSTHEQESGAADGVLQENEKGAIRSLSLPALLAKGTPVDENEEAAVDECECEVDTSPPDDQLTRLRDLIEQTNPSSLRHRQLQQMLRMEERKISQEERLRQERLQARRALLRDRGVSSQNLNLLSDDAAEPMPIPIARDLQRFNAAQKEAEKTFRREKARSVYAGAWLRSTERELHECLEKCRSARDQSFRKNMEAYLEILTNKLELHHKSLGTFNTAKAVEERRRACIELGLLREEDRHLVRSVVETLPTAGTQGDSGVTADVEERDSFAQPGNESSDEEDMFITPDLRAKRSSPSIVPSSIVDDCQISDDLLRMHGTKRPRDGPRSQQPVKKPKNTLFNYFSSQR